MHAGWCWVVVLTASMAGDNETELKIVFFLYFFFFNDTATTEIYTLSLHDALPIWEHLTRKYCWEHFQQAMCLQQSLKWGVRHDLFALIRQKPKCMDDYRKLKWELTRKFTRNKQLKGRRSEEHTSELQSHVRISYAVFCLKKKKTNNNKIQHMT